MSIISHGRVKMANLSVVGSYAVNGVSKLHSDILKKTTFNNFYIHTPGKFTNVTNGIAHRRWLCMSNPSLAALLDETIGPEYRKNPERLEDFLKFADDKAVLERLEAIKRECKVRFSNYIGKRNGIYVNPDTLFDVQVKRLHEYKRQLLNALNIVNRYILLKNNPEADVEPTTFIFGAKAAPGYYMAKRIIKLIWEIGADIDKHPEIAKKMRVIFPEDYNVSMAEVLIPSADISEQLSLAGKEASGTGNMKFMINGALTIGTLDGANVEIAGAVGNENVYIFGLTTPEVEECWKSGYHAINYYLSNSRIKTTVDYLKEGFNGVEFADLYDYLVSGSGIADPYMCLADFESYVTTHARAEADYRNREKWLKSSLVNTAKAGIFAADRAIKEYAENIWHINPVK